MLLLFGWDAAMGCAHGWYGRDLRPTWGGYGGWRKWCSMGDGFWVLRGKITSFAVPLPNSIRVVRKILDLYVLVRIQVGQQASKSRAGRGFLFFMEFAFISQIIRIQPNS